MKNTPKNKEKQENKLGDFLKQVQINTEEIQLKMFYL